MTPRDDPHHMPADMWEPERRSPWLLLLYATVLVATVAISAIFPWGFAS